MTEFFYTHRAWKGQSVIRQTPTTELFDLFIRLPRGGIWQFTAGEAFLADASASAPVAAILTVRRQLPGGFSANRSKVTLETMQPGESVQLIPSSGKDSLNPTRGTPATLRLIDRGKVIVLSDAESFKKFMLQGKSLRGTWATSRNRRTNIWSVQRSQGPKIQKSDRIVPIFKADPQRQLVWGIVLEPDVVDAQGHVITREEIQSALHFFMENSRVVDLLHEKELPASDACVVEAFQAPVDIEWPVGDSVVNIRAGSWVQVTKIHNSQIWEDITAGRINAYSIRGFGKVVTLEVPDQ